MWHAALEEWSMPKPQRGRRLDRLQPANDDPQLRHEVVREFGDTWGRLAWHALVWSQLLIEIPTQLYAYEQSVRAPFEERLRNLRRYWPDSEEENRVREVLAIWRRPVASVNGEARVATISHESGEWPDAQVVAIDFALNGDGEISIRCRNTPADRPKLPPMLRGPYRDRTARQEAARLARAAIGLVAPPSPRMPQGDGAA